MSTIVSTPCSSALRQRVPSTSSASYPSRSKMGILNARMISRTRSTCCRSSGGMGGRCALYSSYSSCLKVGPDRSKEMAQWVGFRSDRFRRKVLRKPYTPRTSSPVVLTVIGFWMA